MLLKMENDRYKHYYAFVNINYLVAQLLHGLQYLHEQDPPVIHGNLKPSNVLIGSKGQLRLAEFGIHGVYIKLSYSFIYNYVIYDIFFRYCTKTKQLQNPHKSGSRERHMKTTTDSLQWIVRNIQIFRWLECWFILRCQKASIPLVSLQMIFYAILLRGCLFFTQ